MVQAGLWRISLFNQEQAQKDPVFAGPWKSKGDVFKHEPGPSPGAPASVAPVSQGPAQHWPLRRLGSEKVSFQKGNHKEATDFLGKRLASRKVSAWGEHGDIQPTCWELYIGGTRGAGGNSHKEAMYVGSHILVGGFPFLDGFPLPYFDAMAHLEHRTVPRTRWRLFGATLSPLNLQCPVLSNSSRKENTHGLLLALLVVPRTQEPLFRLGLPDKFTLCVGDN